jgi:hypothetical protein
MLRSEIEKNQLKKSIESKINSNQKNEDYN